MCATLLIFLKSFFRVKEEDPGVGNHFFALFKKSNKERFALFALLKRENLTEIGQNSLLFDVFENIRSF